MDKVNKFNLSLYIIGFLLINFINFILGNTIFTSLEFRIFQVSLALFIICHLIIFRTSYFSQVIKSSHFILYAVFSIFYLIKVFRDVYIYGFYTGTESPSIHYIVSVCFIIIVPISLISIQQINHKKVTELIYLLLSIIFIARVVLSPVDLIYEERRISGFQNLGIQTLGFYASVLFTWSVIRFLSQKKWQLYRLYNIPMVFLGLYFLALSATRSTIVGSFFVLLLYLFANRQHFNKVFIFTSLFIVLVFTLTMPYWEDWTYLVTNRFQRGIESGNFTGRNFIYPRAIDMFLQSPLLGNHHIIPPRGPWFHNYILDAFVTTGVFGGLVFLLLNIKVVKICVVWLKNNESPAFQFYSLIFLLSLFYGMFIGNLYESQFYWGFLLIIITMNIVKTKLRFNAVNYKR